MNQFITRCGTKNWKELKRLMNRYSQYHTDPDGIIRLAVYNSINSDDTLLEQLRSIDSLAKY